MSKLVYIQASPRIERSHSRAVADTFVEAYSTANPTDEIDTLDLFKEDLPAFDGLALQGKYTIMNGNKHSHEEMQAWKAIEKVIDRFKSADKYLFAVPMWNFGIPYRLKHYLDIIIQPGYTFSFSADTGYTGLLTGKKAAVIYARGGEYLPGTDAENLDHQKKYMDLALGFIGLTDVSSIIVEPTLMGGPETAKTKTDSAMQAAEELAKTF